MISRGTVEGAIAADANDRLATAQDNIDGFGPPPWRVFHGRGDECGDAVDLRGMKDGERPQERNASRMVFFAIGRTVVIYRQLFEEEVRWCLFRPGEFAILFPLLAYRYKSADHCWRRQGRTCRGQGC